MSSGFRVLQTPNSAGWMSDVRARLARRPRPEPLDETDLRRAAVLVPLFVRNGMLWILLTRRTETVEHHRGQISFPGGAEEPDDASLFETALRESEEEIGLKRQDAIPLGSLSPMKTVTNFYVEPFVAAIPQPYVFRPPGGRDRGDHRGAAPGPGRPGHPRNETVPRPFRARPFLPLRPAHDLGRHGQDARRAPRSAQVADRCQPLTRLSRCCSVHGVDPSARHCQWRNSASTRKGRRFWGGGRGHVAYGVKTHGGL